MLLALLLACAPGACEAMCAAALDRFEACLDERGLEWGPAVGYTDAADYADGCATYTWELAQLGRTDECAEKLPVFADGTCEDYDAAWGSR